LRGKPSVFAVWDLYPEVGERLGIFRNRWVVWIVKTLEDFCIHRAAAVQALSEGFLPNLRARMRKPEALVYIPMWIDTDFIQPLSRQNPFSVAHGLDDVFVVLYAGNLGHSQGLEQIVEAADLLANQRDIRFVFVGEGPSRENLVALVQEKRLTNISFISFQRREILPEVLATADLSLVSLQAGFGDGSLPSKTFSILASGRPILAIADPGSQLEKLIELSQAGRFILSGKSVLIRDTILDLYNNPSMRQKMGESGREFACQHHNRRVIARKFEKILLNITLPG
jgi:colanic acid biosynthesis glycosyl transferase WcaI